VRSIPGDFDVRIGIATGDVLVGSIGSEFMMSYPVMGDTVNSASRLEGANKAYGTQVVLAETTPRQRARISRCEKLTEW
jgi:class 3 adenylate cyclase